ncbi:hypothetical protein A2839_00480 [Candidatus Uhrbacteria bacterium RIFCSPHIGHO2_01_FULL_47_10]|nr:MAG: hypothetical protein A2839_00480 [Candidatus Uhrbacteria bacterium RIFCSPHIGHO2_01_FULL_47_10]OGL93587.1 MAG: hypothetical protein A3H12_02705 [Candidatus Uhrbacteria bacterium RIFCSPLOWO2_12_FULL_47_9]
MHKKSCPCLYQEFPSLSTKYLPKNKKDPQDEDQELWAVGFLCVIAFSIFWIACVHGAGITVVTSVHRAFALTRKTDVRDRAEVIVVALVCVVQGLKNTFSGCFAATVLCARILVIAHNRLCFANGLLANVVRGAEVTVFARRVWRSGKDATEFLVATVGSTQVAIVADDGNAATLGAFADIARCAGICV